MPLSAVQKGAIGQYAFLSTAMATGKGQVEAYTPAADNEGRDAEIRRHLESSPGISIQVKVTFLSITEGGTAKYLSQRFALAADRVQNDPRLWYFFAYYEVSELRLHDPVFLVPSHVFHKMARTGNRKGALWFIFQANLEPGSHDRWSPFRVVPRDVGKRLLEIVDDTGRKASGLRSPAPVGSVWLSRTAPGGVKETLRAASIKGNYDLVRNAVLQRQSLTCWYKGHLHLFSPFVLGSKAGDQRVLGYQFGGTSEKALVPDGSPLNWRCLRVAEMTQLTAIPGIWHAAPVGHKSHQQCIDQVDVLAGRQPSAVHRLRRAA
jgi:hypothetical protein